MFRRFVVVSVLIWLFPFSVIAATGAAARTIAALERRPLPPFRMPAVTKRTLANGMRCFILEDHTLPLVRVQFLFPAGSIDDPADGVGVHALMLALLRTGGTERHRAAAIDEALDAQAITIGFENGWEVASANLRMLSTATDAGLQWLVEMLFAPAFDPERITLTKGKVLEGLRRQNDSPERIVHREFRKVVYGAASPWARTPTRKDIDRITRDNLRAAHQAMLRPKDFLCAAAGDIRAEAFVATLNRLMKPYPPVQGTPRAVPAAPIQWRPGAFVVPKATAQTAINVGHRGTDRYNPDKYALAVMNEILGSPHTFRNRLTSTIRTERGLAYEVWSTYGFGPREAPGLFQIHAKTRPEKAAEVVQLIREAVAGLAEGKAITAAEVATMKDGLLKRLVFEYEEPFNIVSEMIRYLYFGFPANYLEQYRAGIARVTADDVRRVAKHYLHPEALQLLLVGNPKGLKGIVPGSVRRWALD